MSQLRDIPRKTYTQTTLNSLVIKQCFCVSCHSLPIVRFRVIPYLYKSVEELRIIFFLFETCYKDDLHILCDTNMKLRVHVFFGLPFFVYVVEYNYFTCVVTLYNTVYV